MRRVSRYYHTYRYWHAWQLAGRLVAYVKRRTGAGRLPGVPHGLHGRLRPRVPIPQHDPWNTRDGLLEGRFRFLNHEEHLGAPRDWTAAHTSLLWRFNLHYFQYLHLLEPDERVAFCREWADANPPGTAVSWYAYPASLRIVNWCRAGVDGPGLLESLYLQAAHLYRNQETYIEGNHLLENAKALVYAGHYFAGQGEAPQWLERGLQLFRDETPEVVLADGGFFERSPMYHAIMLEAYADALNLLPEDHPDAGRLADTVRRMSDFLASVTHPDGNVALFNDATQEIALKPAVLQDYVRRLTGHVPRKRRDLHASGFFVHESDEVFLVVDGGKIAPDHLPAHGHADLFSYELSLGGLPFVVDSGVFEYQAGEMRRYGRGTGAHNTVQVDGVDQAEVYGSFRVARRFDPYDVSFEMEPGRSCFEGAFDGYARLVGDGIVHRREVVADDAARTLRFEDEVSGRGTHRVESRIHLHPDVAVSVRGHEAELRRGDVACTLRADRPLSVEEGWYAPAFGTRLRNTVLVLGGDVVLPVRFHYGIHY